MTNHELEAEVERLREFAAWVVNVLHYSPIFRLPPLPDHVRDLVLEREAAR
jgi:hypothetical protein